MNREEILNAIKELAKMQGFYKRLYDYLTDVTWESDSVLDMLEEQNFKDVVEMVMWIEEG